MIRAHNDRDKVGPTKHRPRTSAHVREVILTARGQYCSSLAVYLPLLT